MPPSTTETLHAERHRTPDASLLSAWWVGSPSLLAAKHRIAAALDADPDFDHLRSFDDVGPWPTTPKPGTRPRLDLLWHMQPQPSLLPTSLHLTALLSLSPYMSSYQVHRLTKHERYLRGSERFLAVRRKLAAHTPSVEDPPYSLSSPAERSLFVNLALGPDNHTASIHYAMFLPTLRNQTSAAQRAAWLPAAKELAIIGCYGQTEMAHGSDGKAKGGNGDGDLTQ